MVLSEQPSPSLALANRLPGLVGGKEVSPVESWLYFTHSVDTWEVAPGGAAG